MHAHLNPSATARPARTSVARVSLMLALMVTAGCQSVDLGEPSMAAEKNLPPTCAVSAGDYKLLAYLRDGGDSTRTAQMVDVLKGKYATAPTVNGDNAVMAAQTFVIAKADVKPVALEQMVMQGCAKQ